MGFTSTSRYLSIISLLAFLSLVSSFDLSSLQTKFTPGYYLKKYGYDVEEHEVTTVDKYILTIHRVLCPNAQNKIKKRPVAFLQHGYIATASNFILIQNQSLGLNLCDIGYDVWMGNFRGNQYSLKHEDMSSNNPKYWAYSWHEMAMYDLPAMIDYTLETTKQQKLTYVGHSQGTTTMFALAATRPDWAASKIKSFHALSPVVFMEHIGGILAWAAPVFGEPDAVSHYAEIPFLPNTYLTSLLGYTVCKIGDVCPEVLNLIVGKSKLINPTCMEDILNTMPAGSSLRQAKHYSQLRNSKDFRQYDFNFLLNRLIYKSATPPSYDLSAVNIPIFLYHAGHDYLSNVKDVNRLIETLNPNTLMGTHYFHEFNHLDFLFSNDDELSNLNSIIINNFNKV